MLAISLSNYCCAPPGRRNPWSALLALWILDFSARLDALGKAAEGGEFGRLSHFCFCCVQWLLVAMRHPCNLLLHGLHHKSRAGMGKAPSTPPWPKYLMAALLPNTIKGRRLF